MSRKRNAAVPFIAFIPIGCALVVIGTGGKTLFLLAGVLMILAGAVGIIRTRQAEGEESPEDPNDPAGGS